MTTFLTKSGKQYQQFTDWVLTNAYRSGDVVIYGNANFRANGDIPANTAFAVGTAGATWYPINNGGIAEYGEITISSDVIVTQGAAISDVSAGGFTLPTAGTWEVIIDVFGKTTGNDGQLYVTLAKTSDNSTVSNSQIMPQFLYNNGLTYTDLRGNGGATLRITTTGSTAYKLRAIAYNKDSYVMGGTRVTWKKISGFVPATGASVDFGHYRSTASSFSAVGLINIASYAGNMPVVSNTNVLLKAGVTYELRAELSIRSQYAQWNWQTSGGVELGNYGDCFATNSVDSGVSAAAYAIYTPSVDTYVQLRLNAISNSTSDTQILDSGGSATGHTLRITYTGANNAGIGEISIKQIGTTATTAFTGSITSAWSLSNSYAAGTIVVQNGQLYQANSSIASGTAFTVGTGANTWSLVGFGTVALEYGQVSASSGSSTVTLTGGWDTVPDLTFTVPTTGTYELNGHITRGPTQARISVTYAINGTAQETYLQHFGYGSYEGGMDPTFTVSLTAGQVITIVVKNTDGAGGYILNDNTRRASLRWKKISGFVPALGATSDYGNYGIVTGLSAAGTYQLTLRQGNMSVVSSTNVLLKAGVTYELVAMVPVVVSDGYAYYQWQLTDGTKIGNYGSSGSLNSTTNVTVAHAYAVYTPSVDTYIQLALAVKSGTISSTDAGGQVTIKQLGTTNTSAFTGMMTTGYSISNTYAAGTIVVNNGLLYQANGVIPAGTTWTVGSSGSTWTQLTSTSAAIPSWTTTTATSLMTISTGGSAYTVPTSGLNENKIQYKQIGPKTWEVVGKVYIGTNVGGVAGTGDYVLTLPAGLSFDTTCINQGYTNTGVGTAHANWNYQLIPGSEANWYYNNTTEGATAGGIVPYSTTQYRVLLVTAQTMTNNMIPWGSSKVPLSVSDMVVTWRFQFQAA